VPKLGRHKISAVFNFAQYTQKASDGNGVCVGGGKMWGRENTTISFPKYARPIPKLTH